MMLRDTPPLSIVALGGLAAALILVTLLTLRLRRAKRLRLAAVARAVARSREGFARDAHDLVGHWLLLASMRGELAYRRTTTDASLHGDLIDIVRAVQAAADDLRNLTGAYRRMSLSDEAHRATLLLNALGTPCSTRLPEKELTGELNALLATIVREGVTNILRHSRATRCAIEVTREDDWIRLTVDNDGVPDDKPASPGGQGLDNLNGRAAELGGSVTGAALDAGRYRLTAQVPVPPMNGDRLLR